MSAHGRRRAAPGSPQVGPGEMGWALVAVVAALIGGLAADRLVHASLLIAVIVSLVVGGVAVVVLFRSPARAPEVTSGYPEDAETGRLRVPQHRQAPTVPRAVPPGSFSSNPPAPAPSAPPTRAAPATKVDPAAPGGSETVVELLPLPGQAGAQDAPWWDSAQGTPAPSAGAKRAPAPDLSTYLASTFIAQCPRCGAFRLDHRRARNGWDFRCESCDHVWTWQPGTPWPPVRVKPGGAGPPAP